MKRISAIFSAVFVLNAAASCADAATSNVDVYGAMRVVVENTQGSPTYQWDAPTLQPLVNELTALGWNTLPMGTGVFGASFIGAESDAVYAGYIEMDINTGVMVFTVTDEGPLLGSILRFSISNTGDSSVLLSHFLENARSVIGAPGNTFNTSRTLNNLTLTGAHHRPLMLSRFPKGTHCMWVTGDIAHNQDADLMQYLGEIGVCKDFAGGAIRAGIGLGASGSKQDLDFGGLLDYSGNHFLAEVDFRTADNLLLSLTGMYGTGSSNIRRAYPSLLIPSTDVSTGSTDTSTIGVRVRADWLDAVRFSAATLSPYVAYTQLYTRQDAYTETGGASPAHYNAISADTKLGVIGLAVTIPLSPRADLAVSIEGVHLFDVDNVPVISGQATALPAFSIASAVPDANYARVGVDFDFAATKSSTVNISAHFSDIEPGPAWSGSISWRVGF